MNTITWVRVNKNTQAPIKSSLTKIHAYSGNFTLCNRRIPDGLSDTFRLYKTQDSEVTCKYCQKAIQEQSE